MKKKFYICNSILLLVLLTNFLPIRAEEDIYSTKSDIHIRQGFTDFGNNQFREYKFKDVSENVGYLTKFPIEKIKQKLLKDELEDWNIEYYVFTSIYDTEIALVESLDMSSIYMINIIDLPLTQGQIGDNCWYQLSVGSFKFLRNNVFVIVSPKISNLSFDLSMAEWLAREIDQAIIESEKVFNTNLIPAPIIQSVDIISNPPENWNNSVVVKVNATDQSLQQLFFRKYASGFSIISQTGVLTFPLNNITDSSNESGKASVKIWVWNEDFITSSVQTEIPF